MMVRKNFRRDHHEESRSGEVERRMGKPSERMEGERPDAG
jgi:hypothetical protein